MAETQQKEGAASVGTQIVEASTEISEATAKLIIGATSEPQKGLCYLNSHVKQVMAEQSYLQHKLGAHQEQLAAGLADIKHTVTDTKQIASLNEDFSDNMLAGLNRMLLDVNQL